MERIAEGAEAIIYEDDGRIVKDRISKKYRIKQIDESLRKFRTKREAKVFQTLEKINFPIPKLIDFSEKTNKIIMENISGKKLRDVLNSKNCEKFSYEVGQKIGILHEKDIIHGDLTTSNMIVNEKDKNRIYFIDFGLSFFSAKAEDKAVDLHLLRQALESKHHTIWRRCFESAIKGYKNTCKSHEEVLKRLETVEARGRYKGKS